MKDVISLDQFRKPKSVESAKTDSPEQRPVCANPAKPEVTPSTQAPAASKGDAKLTKAAQDFRIRFLAAFEALKAQARSELDQASQKSEVKTRINVSSVLKLAKSSPLTAYSPLHREILIPMVEQAAVEHEAAMAAKFSTGSPKRKQTISNLEKELKEAKATFESQLSRLASQKLTEHLSQRDAS